MFHFVPRRQYCVSCAYISTLKRSRHRHTMRRLHQACQSAWYRICVDRPVVSTLFIVYVFRSIDEITTNALPSWSLQLNWWLRKNLCATAGVVVATCDNEECGDTCLLPIKLFQVTTVHVNMIYIPCPDQVRGSKITPFGMLVLFESPSAT